METMSETGRDGPPTVAEGVDLLDAFTTAAHARHDAEVAVVKTLGELVRAGVIETLEGLPIEVHLAIRHHFTAPERAMLLDAADILATMPATMQLWTDRVLSWSQVRTLVIHTRRHGRDLRHALDARVAASADLVELLDADRFEWTITDAIDQLVGPEQKERDEDTAEQDSFFGIQMGLFGRSRISGELDALDTATVTNALDAHTAAEEQAHGRAKDAKGRRLSRAKRRARALIGLAKESLAGRKADGTAIPARPTAIVHIPLDRITATASGLLEVAVPGWLPTLSARLTDALTHDADIRAVVFDGARPLCVTRKLTAVDLPDDTRLAITARDLGARDPAGRTPNPLSHVHHLNDDGIHHPEQLATVSPAGHLRLIHRHGWSGQVDGDTGIITWTRNGHMITTLPWGTPLRQLIQHRPDRE